MYILMIIVFSASLEINTVQLQEFDSLASCTNALIQVKKAADAANAKPPYLQCIAK